MSPIPDDLTSIKDDMIAFIEGHGMRRFHGFVDYEDVQCVMWEMGDNPDGWKDFVELAKAASAPFLTMHSWALDRIELDEMVQRLSSSEFTDSDDVEDARWLRAHVGKSDICSSAGPTRDRCFCVSSAQSGTTATSGCSKSRMNSAGSQWTSPIRTKRTSEACERGLCGDGRPRPSAERSSAASAYPHPLVE